MSRFRVHGVLLSFLLLLNYYLDPVLLFFPFLLCPSMTVDPVFQYTISHYFFIHDQVHDDAVVVFVVVVDHHLQSSFL